MTWYDTMKRYDTMTRFSLCLFALWFLGCSGDNNSQVFISGNILPEEETCELSTTNQLLLSGVLNVERRSVYTIFPLYNNQLRTRTGPLLTNPNGVFIERAEVEVQLPDGTPVEFSGLPNPYSVPAATTFVPSGSVSGDEVAAGQQIGSVNVLTEAYVSQLPTNGVIVARVQVFGSTNSELSVESGTFLWNISLCGGDCLFRCADSDDANASEEPSCLPGQDQVSTVVCP